VKDSLIFLELGGMGPIKAVIVSNITWRYNNSIRIGNGFPFIDLIFS